MNYLIAGGAGYLGTSLLGETVFKYHGGSLAESKRDKLENLKPNIWNSSFGVAGIASYLITTRLIGFNDSTITAAVAGLIPISIGMGYVFLVARAITGGH